MLDKKSVNLLLKENGKFHKNISKSLINAFGSTSRIYENVFLYDSKYDKVVGEAMSIVVTHDTVVFLQYTAIGGNIEVINKNEWTNNGWFSSSPIQSPFVMLQEWSNIACKILGINDKEIKVLRAVTTFTGKISGINKIGKNNIVAAGAWVDKRGFSTTLTSILDSIISIEDEMPNTFNRNIQDMVSERIKKCSAFTDQEYQDDTGAVLTYLNVRSNKIK